MGDACVRQPSQNNSPLHQLGMVSEELDLTLHSKCAAMDASCSREYLQWRSVLLALRQRIALVKDTNPSFTWIRLQMVRTGCDEGIWLGHFPEAAGTYAWVVGGHGQLAKSFSAVGSEMVRWPWSDDGVCMWPLSHPASEEALRCLGVNATQWPAPYPLTVASNKLQCFAACSTCIDEACRMLVCNSVASKEFRAGAIVIGTRTYSCSQGRVTYFDAANIPCVALFARRC